MYRSRVFCLLLAASLMLGMASYASAAVVVFREGGGTNCTNTQMDGVSINTSPSADATTPDNASNTIRIAADPAPPTEGAQRFFVLLAFKDMTTLLPLTTPSTQITAAKLTVYGGDGNKKGIHVRRMVTNWLASYAAGLNDSNVSGNFSNVITSTSWVGGPFSAADYTSVGAVSKYWAGPAQYKPLEFNVLTQVRDMYAPNANRGFALTNIDNPTTNQSSITIQNPNITYGVDSHPTLSITYTVSGGPWALTVNSGTGSGSYAAGTTVHIVANAPASGDLFAGWVGNTNWVWERLAINTYLQTAPYVMAVTATYGPAVTLTVNSGTGSGSYLEGDVVPIAADSAPSGYIFSEWFGNTATVANVALASTSVTIPATNVTLTATYILPLTTFSLTVNSGSGTGLYQATAVVAIVADAAPTGYHFDEWWGKDTYAVANVDSASTTVTMPQVPVQITAKYTRGDRIKFREYLDDDPATTDVVESPEAVEEGFTKATFDDSWVHGKSGVDDVTNPTDYLEPLAASDYSRAIFIAVKEMRNLLTPSTNGMALTIHKAKFWWYKAIFVNGDDWYANDNSAFRVASVKTDWLVQDAGLNEYEVSGMYARTSTLTTWAAGDMSPADWTTGINEQIPFGDNNNHVLPGYPWPDGFRVSIDVTAATREIYASGNNYGYILYPEDPNNQGGSNAGYWDGQIYHSSETARYLDAPPDLRVIRPALVIDYEYAVAYTLTVNSGTGSGTYTEGSIVLINGGLPWPPGYFWLKWVGDTAALADPNAESTNATMPAGDVTVTATYQEYPRHNLTVNSGSGSDEYPETLIVPIVADAAPLGKTFDGWVGDTAGVARRDWKGASTTFTMPLAPPGDSEVTATYRTIHPYILTVDSGQDMSGRSLNDHDATEIVPIAADKPAPWVFDKWIGQTTGIADVNSMYTTITMPASNVLITATYKPDSIEGFRLLLREAGNTSAGYTPTTVDDTYLALNPVDNVSRGTEIYMTVVNGPITGGGEPNNASLICYKDLFTLLPQTSGGQNLQIHSAYMVFFRYQGPLNTPFKIARMTSDWADYAAGTNETTVSGRYADGLDGIDWGPGQDQTRFSSLDYDTATAHQVYIQDGGTNAMQKYNVTDLILKMYEQAANYGLALVPEPGYISEDYEYDTYYGINLHTSEATDAAVHPILQIDYQYGAIYTLTVNTGSGSGSYYPATVVDIVANAPPEGTVFDKWVGNTAAVADVNDDSTTVTMPAANVSVTATYKPIYYLAVENGSGDGAYDAGTVVPIVAELPPTGAVFTGWIGETLYYVADVNATSTTVTMPAANVVVTASYYMIMHTLTVNSGAGGGFYDDGSVVAIAADAAPTGTAFAAWVGDTAYVADVNAASTTVTMPAADVTVTATYGAVYTLTVNGGGGGGGYAQGAVVAIDADAPATGGYVFDVWTGDTAAVAEVNAASTTVTMPAADVTVTATYKEEPTYTLTVNSGSGDGTYAASTVVAIVADAPPVGKVFDVWTGDTAAVAEVNAASTTVTMPAADVTVTATYKEEPTYTLTVNTGSGDGTYAAGTVVAIVADTLGGMTFDKWTGDTAPVANVNAASTTVTMPAGNVTVTATYTPSNQYTLTVTKGSGSGTYSSGTVVAIVANAPPTANGKFLKWTGNTATVANVNAASTTITMPASATAVTAVCTWKGDLNGDLFVGQTDLNIVLAQWGKSGAGITDPRADANKDNFVGQADLNIVLADWGKSAASW